MSEQTTVKTLEAVTADSGAINPQDSGAQVTDGGETDPFDDMDGQLALEEIRGELDKIPSDEVRKLSAPVTQIVGIGLSYAQSYKEDRPLFEETFTKKAFDPAAYDNMEKRAQAFLLLDILSRQAEDPVGPLRELLEEAIPLRKKLLKGALYVFEDHPVHGAVVEEIRSGNGNVDVGFDLGRMAVLFRENWSDAEGRCSVDKQDVVRAQKLSADILKAASPVKTKESDDLRDLRGKAGEYVRRGTEAIRAGAYFIHRDNPDAMERYPSLFIKAKRRNGRNGKDAEETEQPTTSSDQPSAAAEAQPTT